MANFYKEQLKTFLSATLASMSTDVVMNGIAGTGNQINYINSLLSGLQTGTNFVAYPIATNLLEKNSKSYAALCKEFSDPKKKTLSTSVKFYTTNAVAAAAVITAINYPLYLLQINNSKAQDSQINVANYYASQILPNIGFPVVANNMNQILPNTKNSLNKYLRDSFINISGCLGGSVANLPLSTMRDKVPVSQTLVGFVKSIAPTICTQDFVTHFSSVLKSISE